MNSITKQYLDINREEILNIEPDEQFLNEFQLALFWGHFIEGKKAINLMHLDNGQHRAVVLRRIETILGLIGLWNEKREFRYHRSIEYNVQRKELLWNSPKGLFLIGSDWELPLVDLVSQTNMPHSQKRTILRRLNHTMGVNTLGQLWSRVMISFDPFLRIVGIGELMNELIIQKIVHPYICDRMDQEMRGAIHIPENIWEDLNHDKSLCRIYGLKTLGELSQFKSEVKFSSAALKKIYRILYLFKISS